jgi:hypothetical protein
VKLPGPIVTATRSRAGETALDRPDHPVEEGHQRFRLAALHRHRLRAEKRFVRLVENAGGAGPERRVDGENAQGTALRSGLKP